MEVGNALVVGLSNGDSKHGPRRNETLPGRNTQEAEFGPDGRPACTRRTGHRRPGVRRTVALGAPRPLSRRGTTVRGTIIVVGRGLKFSLLLVGWVGFDYAGPAHFDYKPGQWLPRMIGLAAVLATPLRSCGGPGRVP
jgi:hypothetical protein